MIGVDIDRTIMIAFFIGSLLAGIAGVMAGLVFSRVFQLMGFVAGLKAFTGAVIGGIGSIPGAMLGGMLVGLAESFTSAYISSTFQNVIVFGGAHRLHAGQTARPLRQARDREGVSAVSIGSTSGSRRRTRRRGRAGRLVGSWLTLVGVAPAAGVVWGSSSRLAVFVPLVRGSDFLVRVGVNALLLALLAVGLNVSVGWAGLLDLGFIAFYGFGAYAFAILSSDQLGIDLPTLVAVPLVVVATGLLGVVLGLPSRRLSGDYLAIVTLFFSQIFLELALNFDRLGVDLTGGPNGIAGVTRSHSSASRLSSPASYFYLFLTVLIASSSPICTSSSARARGAPGGRSTTTRSRPRS